MFQDFSPAAERNKAPILAALGLLRGVCSEMGAALLLVSHDPAVLGRFERVVELSQVNRAQRTGEVK